MSRIILAPMWTEKGLTAYGEGYLLWWYMLKGPKFVIVR